MAKWLTYKVCDNTKGIGRAFRFYDKVPAPCRMPSNSRTSTLFTMPRQHIVVSLSQHIVVSLSQLRVVERWCVVSQDGSGAIDYTEFRDFLSDRSIASFAAISPSVSPSPPRSPHQPYCDRPALFF